MKNEAIGRFSLSIQQQKPSDVTKLDIVQVWLINI